MDCLRSIEAYSAKGLVNWRHLPAKASAAVMKQVAILRKRRGTRRMFSPIASRQRHFRPRPKHEVKMAATAHEPSRHLVLVHTPGWQDVADFIAIKAHVEEMAPDIAVFIASNAIASSYTRKKAAARPSLIFSPLRLLAFKPDRGKVYEGRAMSKLTEMRRLVEAGMPIPPFEEIVP